MTLVREIMTPNPAHLEHYSTVAKAARLMKDGRFGALPVLEGGQLVGILTDRDLVVRAMAVGSGGETTVSSVMSTAVATAHPDDDVESLCRTMIEGSVRRVPVVDASGALVGIVSIGDVARCAKSSSDPVLKELALSASDAITEIPEH